jgi:hypothetical protein
MKQNDNFQNSHELKGRSVKNENFSRKLSRKLAYFSLIFAFRGNEKTVSVSTLGTAYGSA